MNNIIRLILNIIFFTSVFLFITLLFQYLFMLIISKLWRIQKYIFYLEKWFIFIFLKWSIPSTVNIEPSFLTFPRSVELNKVAVHIIIPKPAYYNMGAIIIVTVVFAQVLDAPTRSFHTWPHEPFVKVPKFTNTPHQAIRFAIFICLTDVCDFPIIIISRLLIMLSNWILAWFNVIMLNKISDI